ncbi:MAG TPA: methenyltetrahydromethanopterin cyclohydrolase [Bacillota bacterium]|nr:hypothetical protein [Fastidiosipila sp.]HQB81669.1 methenyltetrahydromethanopterin cyclohydrolase [Bacillota bacterium]
MFEEQFQMDKRCRTLLERLWNHREDYGLRFATLGSGAQIVDAGVEVRGSLEAGRLITELCQGGCCTTSLDLTDIGGIVLPRITVQSFFPTFSAYKLQAARDVDGKMVSGPIRLCLETSERGEPNIMIEPVKACGIAVVQSDDLPSEAWVKSLASQSGLRPPDLTLVVAPILSVAGATQIAGRVNENVIFSMEQSIGSDSTRVKQLIGSSPVAPLGKDPNDYNRPFPDDLLHYAGRAYLVLDAKPEEDVQKLADALCFQSTSLYGKFFGTVLEEVNGVFMDIPGLLDINKIAQVTINDLNTGMLYHAGRQEYALLNELLTRRS